MTKSQKRWNKRREIYWLIKETVPGSLLVVNLNNDTLSRRKQIFNESSGTLVRWTYYPSSGPFECS